MKILIHSFFAVIFLLAISISGMAQQDTTLKDHVKIVKPKSQFSTPIIKDEAFCEKLKSIKIPGSLKFIDPYGKSCYYFIEIDFCFINNGVFVSKLKENNNPSLKELSSKIILLLKNAKWQVSNGALNHLIKFNCNVLQKGLEGCFLLSYDNLDTIKMCE